MQRGRNKNARKPLFYKASKFSKRYFLGIFKIIQSNSKKLKSLKAFIYRLRYDLSFFVFIEFLNGKQHVCSTKFECLLNYFVYAYVMNIE